MEFIKQMENMILNLRASEQTVATPHERQAVETLKELEWESAFPTGSDQQENRNKNFNLRGSNQEQAVGTVVSEGGQNQAINSAQDSAYFAWLQFVSKGDWLSNKRGELRSPLMDDEHWTEHEQVSVVREYLELLFLDLGGEDAAINHLSVLGGVWSAANLRDMWDKNFESAIRGLRQDKADYERNISKQNPQSQPLPEPSTFLFCSN